LIVNISAILFEFRVQRYEKMLEFELGGGGSGNIEYRIANGTNCRLLSKNHAKKQQYGNSS